MKTLQLRLLGSFIFIASVMHSMPALSEGKPTDFRVFIDDIAQEISKKGMDTKLFYRAFEGDFTPYERAVELLQKQPESKFSFEKYSQSMVSPSRVSKGQEMFKQHKEALKANEQLYKVAPEVVVALWGVETFYGKWPGNHNIIRSLATLAYSSHRKEFFRKELLHAVKILQEGHITPEQMKGSWAGAMGQCQFMPSSFMTYAADGDNDGHKDIWENPLDVFASAANYLHRSGWVHNQPWGNRVVLTEILPPLAMSERGLSGEKTVAEWKKIGLKAAQGDLLADTKKARLFMPDGPSKKAYLVYENFDVILRWNRSSYFAFSVLALADEIAKGQQS